METNSRLMRTLKQSVPATFRLFLALNFLLYGLAKLVIGQFGVPSAESVMANGEGFGMVWEFFGYSRLYEIFIGVGETAAAILLLIPRTYTLGAVVFLPIIANVTMVNYCFNIGVQDLSTVLLIMCLILLWIDRGKLFAVFLQHPAENKKVTKL
ncbi:hypothetical protein [Bacillus atrophaeus]|uniref:hypothetical protein n=1 Tax=Bacillus atrophaeus TaxID=1452 RepID=UPI00398AB95C